MNKKGSVLLHVLVTGVIVSVITAGVLRMTLMNYMATARAATGAQNRKQADAMLSRAITYWNQSNSVCTNIPGGLSCAGVAGTCNCSCPSAGAVPRIDVTAGASGCNISIVSGDATP